ncbi:MAG: hypothetical protein K1X72_04435 [Pyrinomonadaceae bacterium]|nr:hypothetical protein [Pyrinomonadaceae bacterium]
MNSKVGKLAKQEIKDCLGRCTTPRERSAEAERLANHFKISKDRVYAIFRKERDDKSERKTRSDKGKRVASIMENEGLKKAASIVLKNNLDPYKALAQVRLEGYEIPVADETFVRYLAESGLNRKTRRKGKTNYRRFQAELPGDVYQADISGLKERFSYDVTTRKIVKVTVLEESKNHPNENKNRINVWRFALIDDFSRRVYLKYFAVDKPSSSHFIEFFLEAYQELGVPKKLYTDNDAIIKHGRTKRACQILNKALAESGGYEQIKDDETGYEQVFHEPGNSRATGKIERLHQTVEEYEKYLGLYIDQGRIITLEVLDRFAKNLIEQLNNVIHRATGEKPIDRWNSKRHLVRTIDAQLLKSAFLVDEFEVLINGDLTIRHKGETYQLPSDEIFINLVAAQSKKNKVKIILPDDADFLILIDFDGNEYEIDKAIATSDAFGDFKSLPEEQSVRNRKELIKFAKENAKAEKAALKEGQQPKPIAIIDTPTEFQKTNVLGFPKPKVDVTERIIKNLAEQRTEQKKEVTNPISEVRKMAYSGKLITFWDAVNQFQEKFASKAECKEFLLLKCFKDKNDKQSETQVREIIEAHFIEISQLRIAN